MTGVQTCALPILGEAPAAGFTYSWLPATGLSDASIANPTANPSVTTTYTVTKTNTTTGCKNTDDVIVTVDNAAVTVSAGADFTKTCTTNADGKQIGEAPAAGFTYSWLPATGLSDASIANPTANPSVTTTYTVTKTNTATGCKNTDDVIVTVDNAAVTVSAGADFTKTCVTNPDGKQIGEAPVAGFTYSWLPATGLSDASIANPTANPSVTTTYTVTKTNTATGCKNTDDVIVTVNSERPATPNVSVIPPTCTTATGTVTVTSPVGADYEYSKDGGVNYQSNPSFTFPASTSYSILVRRISTGCSSLSPRTGTIGTQPTNCGGAIYTYTQGFYGSTGSGCTPLAGPIKGAVAVVKYALDNRDGILGNSTGQIYLGKSGASITINYADAAKLVAIMPGGGTAGKLGNNYNLSALSFYPPLKNGRIDNVFLSQTITLALNVSIAGNSL